jgi:hypothetical protein
MDIGKLQRIWKQFAVKGQNSIIVPILLPPKFLARMMLRKHFLNINNLNDTYSVLYSSEYGRKHSFLEHVDQLPVSAEFSKRDGSILSDTARITVQFEGEILKLEVPDSDVKFVDHRLSFLVEESHKNLKVNADFKTRLQWNGRGMVLAKA